MTDQERRSLQSAVDHLNAVLAGLKEAHGSAIHVRPIASFSDFTGCAQVRVEITTGVVVIGPSD